jgi:uncharacterized repeat protein (TIGR03943 family)
VKRNLQVLLILLTGAGMLHIALFSDVYLRYVQPGLRIPLIISGILLVVLGFIGAARDGFPFNRPEPTGDDHQAHDQAHDQTHNPAHDQAHDHGHDHGHDHSQAPRIAWLLYVPALSLLLFAPPALGSYTASRDDNTVAQTSTAGAGGFPALKNATGTVDLSLSEFTSRAIWDTGHSMKGRTLRLTGFVTPGSGGTWYLSRLVVTCCAADAQVLKVEMHDAKAPPADAWVTVTGQWRTSGRVGTDSARAALNADSVERIAEPKDPYG